jgi:hypothetical protein
VPAFVSPLNNYAILTSLVTAEVPQPGTPVLPLTGTLTHLPDTYTIQIDAHTYLLPDGHLWRYLNRSYAPN